ncbi:MAG: copper transporter [Acidimicrobiales bacterium]|nr:copper transporter [Acidimicrobiales bacterium]
MINLRYHIVSLTAVFLAMGIGLALGSTFLERATVDNFDGQLDSLQTRLEDREDRIGQLQNEADRRSELDEALDEQASGLLAGRLDGVPVVVLSSRGVEETDVRAAVQSLVVASADVQGTWWLTDRWRLDDDGEVSDLADLLDEDSADPSRLRRTAIDALGGDLRARSLLGDDAPPESDTGTDEVPSDEVPVDPESDPTSVPADTTATDPDAPQDAGTPDVEAATPDDSLTLLEALIENGFIEFEAVPGGPEEPQFPDGTRLLLAGGSPDVPDDLVLEPLLDRMGRATDIPVLAVLSSATEGDGGVSDAVLVVRQDEALRELVSTVDALEHFDGFAAMILALADLADGTVGHYGLDESASRLLPTVRSP